MTIVTDRLMDTEPERVSKYDGRAIDFRWVLLEEPVDHHGSPAVHRVYATLTVQHHGKADFMGQPNKCFTAVVSRDDITEGDKVTVVSIHIGGPHFVPSITIGKEPCERFSAKRLTEYAEIMLETLRDLFRDDARVLTIFGETA